MSTTVDQPAVVETSESKPVAQAEPVESKPEPTAAESLGPVSTEAPKTESAPAAPAGEKASISDGVLGYKAPGLIKSFRFVKKYFWFGDEAVAAKDLQAYLREEKADVAQPNVAWSSQTGKGLLYFAKHADLKAAPSGIINLADITEPTKDSGVEFYFKLHGQKHSFQAPSTLERDAWLERIEAVAAEAKMQAEGIKNSAGYKENVEQIGKLATTSAPAAAAATAPRKSSDRTASGVKSDSSSSDSSQAPVQEKKPKSRRSRSASRKRTSLFGNLLGRKEDHEEKKTEAAAAKPTETGLPKEGETAKKTDDAEAPATVPPPLDAPVVAARVVDAPAIPVDEDKPAPIAKDTETPSAAEPIKTAEPTSAEPLTPKDAPKPTKRNSFFDSVFRRRDATTPAEEKKDDEPAPAVPAKDSEISATAPTLPEPATVTGDKPTEPIETPAPAVPVTTDAPKEKPSTPKESFFGRLLNLVEGKPQENKDAKVEDTKKVETAAPVAAAETPSTPADGTTEAPAAAVAPDAAATTSAGQPAAESTMPGLSKDKRRSSFFALASRGKEKKSEATSDSENTGNTSPIPRLSGLFRKPSRGAKAMLGQDKVESAPATAEAKSETKPLDTGAAPAVAPTEGTTTTITADAAAPVQESSEAPQAASTTDDISPVAVTPATAQPTKPASEAQAAA